MFDKIHIIESNCWYIFGTMQRTQKICVVKTAAKMFDWGNHDFHGLKLSYLFLIQRLLSKK